MEYVKAGHGNHLDIPFSHQIINANRSQRGIICSISRNKSKSITNIPIIVNRQTMPHMIITQDNQEPGKQERETKRKKPCLKTWKIIYHILASSILSSLNIFMLSCSVMDMAFLLVSITSNQGIGQSLKERRAILGLMSLVRTHTPGRMAVLTSWYHLSRSLTSWWNATVLIIRTSSALSLVQTNLLGVSEALA
jgi:hypothetical protein